MSAIHGKNTYISVTTLSPAPTGAHDISPYCDTSAFNYVRDSHDLTTYGQDGHVYGGGLTNHSFSCGGKYDTSTTAGPRAIFGPLMSATGEQLVSVTRRVEGTGSGKPEETFNALLTGFVETSPVADYVTWSADFQVSGSVTRTTQGA